jgi:hypothetical protein
MTRAASLLVRTTLVLAVSAIAIAATAILALNTFVIRPIAERSADDEAALLVLSAQTWVELPPKRAPVFRTRAGAEPRPDHLAAGARSAAGRSRYVVTSTCCRRSSASGSVPTSGSCKATT